MPVAVVTGASQGVGWEVTRQLLDKGYRVHAQYRTAINTELEHPNVHWWRADFRQSLDPMAVPDVETLDVLVHCAGIAVIGTAQPRSVWEEHMAVNLHAPVELTHALLPALIAAHGDVVYINSGAGLHAHGGWGAYCASKFAARGWCDALRQEVPDIRVTSIYPGGIATNMQRAIRAHEHGEFNPDEYLSTHTVAQTVIHAIETDADGHINDISIRPR